MLGSLVLCLARFTASESMRNGINSDMRDRLPDTEDNITVTATQIPREDASDESWRYALSGAIMLLFVCGMIFMAWYLMKTRIEAKMTYMDIGEANENSQQLAA